VVFEDAPAAAGAWLFLKGCTMVQATVATATLTDLELMAHLYRRAGFGARRDELEAALAKGYEATIEELIHPERAEPIDVELIYRYYGDMKEAREIDITQAYWVYRMINTKRPLEEKMALFWHHLFATAFNKSNHAQQVQIQIDMLREYCLADFRTILVELSKDPAMIFWLDNQENTNEVHNENYGRELLELFSMGIGNYTEDDVKDVARAFTGWSLHNIVNGGPFGRNTWEFEFRPDQHDFTEKTVLGETGNFDGGDVIDIIVRQPATARFLSYRLYTFFVSDQPDDAVIDELVAVYERTGGNVREMMRWLLLSDAFRSRQAYYDRVKSPAEMVAGVARLVEDFQFPQWGIVDVALECRYMGQDLMNPPSVEGWHTGKEWIDTGILVERINFAAGVVGDTGKPGVRKIINRLRAMGELSPTEFVDACLDLVGPLPVNPRTHSALVTFAEQGGPLRFTTNDPDPVSDQRVAALLQLIVATREFQFA
jgi:uncharacterized protein (DUF1800 family)